MRQESIQVALALLLGPETDYQIRTRATRRLTKQGLAILPSLLTTLNNYPEITTPPWPWWPPQYEHISRLLLSLIQYGQLHLEDLLHHPVLEQPIGPVLWISVLETTNLLPHSDHEKILCEGLQTPWTTVRYSAAMALATRAGKVLLQTSTMEALKTHVGNNEPYPVRLAVSYALLSCNEHCGLAELLSLTLLHVPCEVRKATVFILATDLPCQLTLSQREQLAARLLELLLDPDIELAHEAAHAFSKVVEPVFLPALYKLLETSDIQRQFIILTVLEEIAHKQHIRDLMRQHSLPTRLVALMKADDQMLRRQACYTLATCGGEYVAAVFGTIVLNNEHPGHIEAIESLRQLHGVLRAPLRANVVRWLLRALSLANEETCITAVDTLTHLLWQAQTHGYKQAWQEMSNEIIENGIVIALLQQESSKIRQHVIESLVTLDSYLATNIQLRTLLKSFLSTDSDSGVRACIAYVYGQTGAHWAIPDLIYTLLDPDEQVARTALNALTQITAPDNTLVISVISELAHLYNGKNRSANPLAYEAWIIMQKRQKSKPDEPYKKLHSFS